MEHYPPPPLTCLVFSSISSAVPRGARNSVRTGPWLEPRLMSSFSAIFLLDVFEHGCFRLIFFFG